MAVREYIGARYIPLFADPIEWDGSLAYEALTVVKYQGASYVSRQAVPENIALTDENYWILWADYNAQLEQYRREVQAFDGRITAAQQTADGAAAAVQALNAELGAEVTARTNADNAIRADFAQDLADEVASINATIAADVDRLETQDEGINRTFGANNNPVTYGADPTGVADSAAAINAAIEANKGGVVTFAPGTYKITEPIILPYADAEKVSINGNGAIIKTAASMPQALFIGGDVETVELATVNNAGNLFYIRDLVVDCADNVVQYAIDIRTGVKDAHIINCTLRGATNGLRIGSDADGIGVVPSDVLMDGCQLFGVGAETPSAGIVSYCSDNKFTNSRIYGYQTGVRMTSSSHAINVQVLLRFAGQTVQNFWPYAKNSVEWNAYYNQTIGFDIYTRAFIIDCYSDTVHTGVKINTDAGSVISGTWFYWPHTDVDAIAIDASPVSSGNINLQISDCIFTLPQFTAQKPANIEVWALYLGSVAASRFIQIDLSSNRVEGSASLSPFDLLKGSQEGSATGMAVADSSTWYVIGCLPYANTGIVQNYKQITFYFNSNLCELDINASGDARTFTRTALKQLATSTSTTTYEFALHPVVVGNITALLLCARVVSGNNLSAAILDVKSTGLGAHNIFNAGRALGQNNVSNTYATLQEIAETNTPQEVLTFEPY